MIDSTCEDKLYQTPKFAGAFRYNAALRALDDRFIAANLSPGGSADLLALCYLLHFFKTEVMEDV